MIINKDTSNALLVNSLAVFNAAAIPIGKLKEFNTETLVATKNNDSTITAASFWFAAASEEDAVSIRALLPNNLISMVWCAGSQSVVYSMTQAPTDPDYFLLLGEQVVAKLAKCGKCGEQFVVWVDGAGNVWSAGKTNGTDKHPKAVKLTTLACDACAEPLLLRR